CDFGYIRRVALLRLLIDLIADIPGAVRANGDAFHDTPRTYSSPEPSRGRRVVDALAAQVSRVAHTHERQQPLLEHWQPDIAHVEITVGDQLEQFSPVGDSHRDGEEEHLQFPHIDHLGVAELVTLKQIREAREVDAAVAIENSLAVLLNVRFALLESCGGLLHDIGRRLGLLSLLIAIQQWRTDEGSGADTEQRPNLPIDRNRQGLRNLAASNALDGNHEKTRNDEHRPNHELKARQTHQ